MPDNLALPEHLNLENMLAYLRDECGWPLREEIDLKWDTYEYTPQELYLNEGHINHIEGSIREVAFTDPPEWGVFAVRFKSNHISVTVLRQILRGLVTSRANADNRRFQLDNIIFLTESGQSGHLSFSFCHFSQSQGQSPKISIFGLDEDHMDEHHTLLSHNLPALTVRYTDDGSPDWQATHDLWRSAWDVSRVTDEFYTRYRELFRSLCETLSNQLSEEEAVLFSQRLMNRILFMQFIQKKGWLRHSGSSDYFNTLYHHAIQSGVSDFYNQVLWPVLYVKLGGNTEYDEQLPAALDAGELPLLGGEIFEPTGAGEQRNEVNIPNDIFTSMLDNLLNAFNFTVMESTPLDTEVAVDPEMLGRIFEELVTGRHESGSYYTPKDIVSYMCREALITYLHQHLPDEPKEILEEFVYKHDSTRLRRSEEVLDALRNIRAVDPACGSGAYLLGLLHELLDLRKCLFASGCNDAATSFERKSEIISQSLYGVDIDAFAVSIAQMRLWLSLMVDYAGDTPQPLPNLEYKVACGDSLLCETPVAHSNLAISSVKQFWQLKQQFLFEADHDKRKALRSKLKQARENVAVDSGFAPSEDRFEWRLDFAEVFTQPETGDTTVNKNSGFDVVLANPPYVRQEKIIGMKPELQRIFKGQYQGTADLYTYFYVRAVQLLKPGGVLAFISSNKWFRAAYGKKLRQFMVDNTDILNIVDFGDLQVFKSATAYPMIFTAQKGQGKKSHPYMTKVETLNPPYPDIRQIVANNKKPILPAALNAEGWSLASGGQLDRLERMKKAGLPLGELVKHRIYYGIKTGYNQAFIIDGATRKRLIAQHASSAEIIKPLAKGTDIRRWHINNEDRWLIFTRKGTDIERYPAIYQYLEHFKMNLMPRPVDWDSAVKWGGRKPGRYKWYEIQDDIAYYKEFEKPKVVWPDICLEPRFTFHSGSLFVANTGYIMPCDAPFLASLLNSESVTSLYKQQSSAVRGNYIRYIRQYIETIPIPDMRDEDKQALSILAQLCLDAKGQGCEVYEREINERVAALYGL